MLLPELAEKIVKEVRKLIDEDIIVVNTEGSIIASTDLGRMGTFHEGALIAAQKKRKFIITQEDQKTLIGVRAGINFPIIFQNDVIGVIGITGEPNKVTAFGEIIRKMTELLISENYYAEQFDWHSRALESFVMDWIQSKNWDETFLNRARLFSVDLTLMRSVVIVEFSQINHPLSRDGWSSIFNWFSHPKNEVVARLGNERLVLFIDTSKYRSRNTIEKRLTNFFDFLKNSFGFNAFAGVGQESKPHKIYNSYRQAERALNSANKHRKIVFDADLTLEMIVEELSLKTRTEFINRTIGQLLHEKELVETIKELFNQNYSLKHTSEKLHIHINTLHYRLKKIEDLTRLNHQNIHDLLTLYLAFYFLEEQPVNLK